MAWLGLAREPRVPGARVPLRARGTSEHPPREASSSWLRSRGVGSPKSTWRETTMGSTTSSKLLFPNDIAQPFWDPDSRWPHMDARDFKPDDLKRLVSGLGERLAPFQVSDVFPDDLLRSPDLPELIPDRFLEGDSLSADQLLESRRGEGPGFNRPFLPLSERRPLRGLPPPAPVVSRPARATIGNAALDSGARWGGGRGPADTGEAYAALTGKMAVPEDP